MGILDNLEITREATIIISIVWGLGLSAIFRKACNGRNCIVMRGPSPSEMENKIYKFDNKCYRYKAQTTKCTK